MTLGYAMNLGYRALRFSANVAIEDVLPLVTSNTAAVLKLPSKGRLAPGCDGDVAVFERDTLAPRHLAAGGRVLMRDGAVVARESFLEDSTRRIRLHGSKEA